MQNQKTDLNAISKPEIIIAHACAFSNLHFITDRSIKYFFNDFPIDNQRQDMEFPSIFSMNLHCKPTEANFIPIRIQLESHASSQKSKL